MRGRLSRLDAGFLSPSATAVSSLLDMAFSSLAFSFPSAYDSSLGHDMFFSWAGRFFSLGYGSLS